tara:strand:- start:1249 stop:1764 length:516 start_codon:yes stop_codon:yes gene_type:complete
MAITTAAGISTTTVTTDQQAPLGFELVVPTANGGDEVWIYVQATAALGVGIAAMRDAGASTYTVSPTTAATAIHPARVVGVAQHAIATASYGFILKRGLGTVQAGNGAVVGADRGLTTAGTVVAGTFADVVANASAITDTEAQVIAWCVTASAAAGPAPAGRGTAMIDCKG